MSRYLEEQTLLIYLIQILLNLFIILFDRSFLENWKELMTELLEIVSDIAQECQLN
jgi:hypothetical protein